MIGVPFLGAESFPKPGNSDEVSLLGVYFGRTPELRSQDIKGKFKLGMNGPAELKLSLDDSNQGVLWLKVEPGLYTIVPADGFNVAAGVPDSVEVPPSSVVLAPFRLVRTTEGALAERIDEGNRQFSGLDLANHIDYSQWSDRNLIGFGTLRPTLDHETLHFTVNISADPEGAEVYVDDVLAGVTPLAFSLVGGKHRLMVRSAGFENAIYYVRLEGDAEINAVLQPATETLQSDKERYSTLVAPFVSMNRENDQLARLFADTLLLTLEADERLEVVPSTVPWVRRDALIHPDFLPLEEVGADLVVSGFFAEVNGRLSIQANLYDVQAETIRAAVTWLGTAGFDIFDAMDEIALEFADEVDRVLPAAGRTLITRQETVYSGADRGESLLARKKLIRKRWEDNPNVLSLQGGFGGFMEEYDVNDSGFTTTAGKFEGPFLPIIFSWEHDIGPSFAVSAGTSFAISSYGGSNDNSEDREATWMASIFAGPRLVFRSLRADITIGIDLQVQYSPRVTYHWIDGVDRQADVGALLYLDLPMKVNFRYYFNKRIDTMPVFLSGGLGVSPLGYRFDLGGTGQKGMMSTYLFFNLGIGLRL